MNKLYNIIKNYQQGNKESIIEVIELFNPLLNKLERQSNHYDIKSELTLFIIELMDKLPFENEKFCHDKYIVSYISKSIKNKYIYLNKKACDQLNKENEINLEILKNDRVENNLDMILFKDLIKSLTHKEQEIIIYKYGLNYSDIEIAELFNISRQSVNKTKTRALNKLKLMIN
ncbi:sigma-70 family RNA polymerase sigma factor [Paraclostridium sordellii]|uniref:sigma-70 family RNA polymerase sigma factor n=1 Tax=Paraclostridium sordellii TaxID=1505 RepID=UPI0005EA1AA0|nr:sigma-70 family RNA polymerase sigma factor [Paeniclostridium sordellii]CEN21828.1 uviA protein [[Clostridium] sordellii] [Paeniclostridium sordellii]